MSYEQHKFTVEIDLGNEAMQSLEDIAEALETIVGEMVGIDQRDAGTIHDVNGNTVGSWAVR